MKQPEAGDAVFQDHRYPDRGSADRASYRVCLCDRAGDDCLRLYLYYSEYRTKDEKKADYIRILEQRRVDGAILMGSMFETEAVKKSIKEHLPDVPVAIVNGYLDLPNVYGILIDEERGVKDCAELMFKKGKKHLVMAVDSDTPSNRNKQKRLPESYVRTGDRQRRYPVLYSGK